LADFAQLNGDPAGQEKVEKIRDKPAICWTAYPSTFNILGGKRELLATDTMMRVVRSLQENCKVSTNIESGSSGEEDYHQNKEHGNDHDRDN
jgi:hypothetical protein